MKNRVVMHVPIIHFLVYILFVVSVVNLHADEKESSVPMGHDGAGEIAVAQVNGVDINMEALMSRMLKIAGKKYGQREISPLVAEKIKNDALDELVTEELAYQKSFAKIGALPPEKIDQTLEAVRKEKEGNEGFQKYLKHEMLSEDAFRRQLTRTMTVQAFIEEEFEKKIKVSDEELQAAYLGAKNQYFVQQEKVQVADIIFFLDPKSDDSIRVAEGIREKIINELDNKASNLVPDGTFVVQENIGLTLQNNEKLYNLAKSLGPYGVSHPVEVKETLHVVQLTGYSPAISKDLEDVREYLTDELKKRKKQALLAKWITHLKDGASITILSVDE